MWRKAAEDAGIQFVAIPTGKFRRYLSLRNLDRRRAPATRCPCRAAAALAAFHPDVVLSTGGFVSVPAVVAARGIAPVLNARANGDPWPRQPHQREIRRGPRRLSPTRQNRPRLDFTVAWW